MRVPKYMPYAMISCACALLLVFKVYPLLYTTYESFFPEGNFSLQIYRNLGDDTVFWNALWVTLRLNIVIIPVQVVVSLSLALLVNANVRGVGVFRTVYFLPFTVSSAVACVVWALLFAQTNGVINSILSIFEIPAQKFFQDKNQALWCIVAEASWVGCGYWMTFFLAGLKSIDTAVYESAKVDGAGYFRTLWAIVLPLLKNTMLFVVVANTTANLLLFTPMKLITNGGPMGSTNTLMYEAYKSAFKYNRRPRSSAIVTVLLLLIAAVCAIQFYMMRDREPERMAKA